MFQSVVKLVLTFDNTYMFSCLFCPLSLSLSSARITFNSTVYYSDHIVILLLNILANDINAKIFRHFSTVMAPYEHIDAKNFLQIQSKITALKDSSTFSSLIQGLRTTSKLRIVS